jgi:transposase-like protein
MKEEKGFFLTPEEPAQRHYEALRARFIDHLSPAEAARKFGLARSTFYALVRDFRAGRLEPFFVSRCPGRKHSPLRSVLKDSIAELRKQNRSATEIAAILHERRQPISVPYVIRILKEEGFARLPKRSRLEIERPARVLPVEDEVADVRHLNLQKVDGWITAHAGLFLLIPQIVEMDLVGGFEKAGFPGSKMLPAANLLLSFLTLKCLDKSRHSHTTDVTFDRGTALFAGLNSLPKTTALSDYSYRLDSIFLEKFLRHQIAYLKREGRVRGHSINLDFHPIPHWGEDSVMDHHWVPTRGKGLKAALTFFAQDQETTYLCYVKADIRRRETAEEIQRFAEFWKDVTGEYPRRLIFDSKLTSYRYLQWLDERNIVYVTLQRRPPHIDKIMAPISPKSFRTIRIPKIQRKYQRPRVYEEYIPLAGIQKPVRRFIVTNLGREEPMLLITNDAKTKPSKLLVEYAHRWRVENSLAEQIDFFHLNSLGSPLQIGVAFDSLMSFTAHTLLKQFARKLRGYEHCTPRTLYREFLNIQGKITVQEDQFTVEFERRRNNPVIRAAHFDLPKQTIPWLGGRVLNFSFR